MADDDLADYYDDDYFDWLYVEDDYPLAVSDVIYPLLQDFLQVAVVP